MIKKHAKNILIIAVFALIVISPQIYSHSLILGSDSLFHFNRFYDMASQINDHNWQYFVSMYGFTQSGRIVNAIYGPLLAYLHGFILWITRSWFLYQIISDFMVMFIAGCMMYYLLIQNKVSQRYLMPLSTLYMLSYVIFTWTISQQFLSWGAAILPLGVSVATRLVREKDNPVNILEMTLAVTLMLQTHVLSSLLLIILLTIFFIIAILQSADKKRLLLRTLIAALCTIFLTANIWGSFLEVYMGNQLIPPFKNKTPQSRGSVAFPIDNLKLFFPYVLLFGYQIFMTLMHWRHTTLVIRTVTIIGTICLVLSSSIIPWNTLFKIHFISLFQFPYRLLPTAIVLLLLGLGLTLTISDYLLFNKKQLSLILITAMICILANNIGIVHKKAAIWHTPKVLADKNKIHQDATKTTIRQSFYANKRLHVLLDSVWKPTPDYLPVNGAKRVKEPYKKYNEQIARQQYTFVKYVENKKLYILWYATKPNYKTINVIKYAHTRLKLNGKPLSAYDYQLTKIGAVRVRSKVGENVMQLSYQPAKWFMNLMTVNKLAWFILACYTIYVTYQRIKKVVRDKSHFGARV